jgi:mono/diheme cytochrome c family protein
MTRHVALAAGVLCSILSAAVLATPPTVSWKLFPEATGPVGAPTGKAEFQNACAICHGADAQAEAIANYLARKR